MATTDSRSRSVGAEERSDGVKPNSSDLEQITRERDEAVGLLRRIVEIDSDNGMGVIGWSEVIGKAEAFLSRLATMEKTDGVA